MKSIITEIKRLDQAATKWPWAHVNEYADEPHHCVIKTGEPFYCMVAECCIDDEQGNGPKEQADADLIAFYRNNTPALAEAYEKLMEAAERMAKYVVLTPDGDKALAAFNALKSGTTGVA
jgi:hypothetical protein